MRAAPSRGEGPALVEDQLVLFAQKVGEDGAARPRVRAPRTYMLLGTSGLEGVAILPVTSEMTET